MLDRKIALEKILLHCSRAFNPEDVPVNPPELIQYWEPRLNEMIVGIKWTIMGKKYEPIEICYPADWWQAFRERWFRGRLGRWWLRKYPVQKTTHRIIVEDLFPKIPVPDGRRYVEMAVIKPGAIWNYEEPPRRSDATTP